MAGEPAAVDAIVTGCARLPLALTIAAARAATRPGFPLAVVAAELREATRALDPFHGGDLATDVRAVFSWSYRALSAAAARLFRLLGLHPGPDIAVAATASLAAIPADRARELLAELTRAHLLAEHISGPVRLPRPAARLRRRAGPGARQPGRPRRCRASCPRSLPAQCLPGRAADRTAFRSAHPGPAPRPGVIVGEPATAEQAMAWFTAEHATLLAAVYLAAEARGRHPRVAARLDPEHLLPAPRILAGQCPGAAGRPGCRPPPRRRSRGGPRRARTRPRLCQVRSLRGRLPAVPGGPAAVRRDRRPHRPSQDSQQPHLALGARRAPRRCAQPRHPGP